MSLASEISGLHGGQDELRVRKLRIASHPHWKSYCYGGRLVVFVLVLGVFCVGLFFGCVGCFQRWLSTFVPWMNLPIHSRTLVIVLPIVHGLPVFFEASCSQRLKKNNSTIRLFCCFFTLRFFFSTILLTLLIFDPTIPLLYSSLTLLFFDSTVHCLFLFYVYYFFGSTSL